MDSTRRSRNASKRLSKANEESPGKERGSVSRGKARKRKLSDMLGSQWTKEELEHFYEAYRSYGKDWKKVAGAIRNRSFDMVEALYNMNKAYLSLPDGMATAAGLIAMMTDHYNILEGTDSDQESNDGIKTSNKSQKRGRGKLRANSVKGTAGRYPDLLQFQSSPSNYGFSLSKKRRSGDLTGTQPRVVGKRTPRFPVSYISNKIDRNITVSPKRQGPKFGRNAASDDEGAHVAALALAEASQRGGSPQVSRTPGSRADVHSGERKHIESEVAYSKFNVQLDEDYVEGSLGSREAENEDFIKDSSHPLDSESGGTVATKRKVRRLKGKRPKSGAEDQFDDAREACSGTEEGTNARSIKDDMETELSDRKGGNTSQHPKSRSRQLFFGDEGNALDALQTLADLSLNMLLPSSTVESESSAQIKEEKKNQGFGNHNADENMSKNDQRDKTKCLKIKEKSQSPVVGVDIVKRKNSKYRRTSAIDTNISSETKQEADQSIGKIQKRKRRTSLAKVPKTELHAESGLDKTQKTEVSTEEEKKYAIKTKHVSQFVPPSRQIKLIKLPEYSSSSTDLDKTAIAVAEMAPQVSSEVHLPTRIKNRRKMSLYKEVTLKELKPSEGAGENHLNDRTVNLKEKLSHSLSSSLLRRWCTFEWFYSAIDYPWFAKSEFVEYLNHVGLGHVPRLTRVEWGVIRSSLGKPRRLSRQFLQEEREKLKQYRESVRTHYTELRAGTREGLPTDLARPLSVGQRVIACHPKMREIHDGSVLTVDHNRCRVQFDRPELGVEFVMDIDCMPLNPLENIPDALKKQNLVADRFYEGFKEIKPYDHLKEWNIGASIASSEIIETAGGAAHCYPSDYPMNSLMKHAKGDTIDAILQAKAAANEVALATRQAMYSQPYTVAQIKAKEDDIRALSEMTRALDKKEALLIELRHMNEEVSLNQKEGEAIKDIENFRKQYAMVLLQLRDANDLVASALLYLRQRNTFVGNSTPPRLGTMENSVAGSFNESSYPGQDAGSHIMAIVETSRRKAKAMVAVAVQAMSSMKEGEDAFVKVGEALDSTRKWQSGADSGTPAVKSFLSNEPGHGNSSIQDQACVLEPPQGTDSHDVKSNKTSNRNESQFPSDLISSCVSTLLIIQSCTERQCPPAEVAQILESAVTSLLPCCSQNLPIYREIESCMAIIKNQMLALIPTPSAILPTEHSVL